MELAKANGEVDSKGNALIQVITDGSWGKRSYGRHFSSLSGCTVIIGLRTNKIIYFDVRNKYCHICKLAEVHGVEARQHNCNKNYDGPSTGMESDIIVNGFRECDKLGARFNVLISDGDSNTYKIIRDMRIYKEPDVYVVKLECVNHLYRNFYKKFNNLGTVKAFGSNWRKKYITPSFCLDICKGIRKASQYWRDSEVSHATKIRSLEKDVLNAPAHYFGDHRNCATYYCDKTTALENIEMLNLLKSDGLFYEIQSLCQTYFGNNAKSLIANYTNNPAEQFNGYVAKYLGGKRINYSLAGSYTARVAMAVVHFNSDCHASSQYRKIKLGAVPDMCSVTKLENKRKMKNQQTAIARTKKPKVRRTQTDRRTDVAYGGEYSDDMDPRSLQTSKNMILEQLTHNQTMRVPIETTTKNDEHYFFEKTRNMLMSNYFSTIICSKGPKSYAKILDEILYTQKQLSKNAQHKHQRVQELEALTEFRRIYKNTKVDECGLFIDEELPFLGARPFRLVGPNHLLSIKCPLSSFRKKIEEAKLPLWKTVEISKFKVSSTSLEESGPI
ncbi:hypothetical protein Bhyg_07990 [Pseudolycoriella hygida]|uniref:Mutator-like transposase domain-containing protein n=1 Tax=Pseudolycoriella hygida TaxID=35572 RepID=A0A9Q0S380_9DIPT|nr:hypothetical protein Bhyg_07990 [Pseudolycoriella hygida]